MSFELNPVNRILRFQFVLFYFFSFFFHEAGLGSSIAGQTAKTIRIAGSTTVAPIASRAAEIFSKKHPEIRIIVNGGGSGVGVNAVGRGQVDIGMASREMTQKELKRFAAAMLSKHIVGRDGVACAVSSEIFDAGVKTLSKKQIGDIYSGRVKSWKAFGGPDRRILVIDKEKHRGTRHVFMKYVFNKEGASAKAARLITGSNNEERSKIAQSDSAIGMLSAAWLNAEVKGVALNENETAIYPTEENIRKGVYPVVRNLLFITAGEAKGMLKEFIDFVQSAEGSSIVKESGYVPVHGS